MHKSVFSKTTLIIYSLIIVNGKVGVRGWIIMMCYWFVYIIYYYRISCGERVYDNDDDVHGFLIRLHQRGFITRYISHHIFINMNIWYNHIDILRYHIFIYKNLWYRGPLDDNAILYIQYILCSSIYILS